MNDAGDHTWFRQRLVAFRLGILLGEEAERFRRHLASCESCWEEFASFSVAGGAAVLMDGHLPSSLVSRWDRVRREVRGFERQMLRNHIESCEQCREDLEFAGHAPDLEFVPELEDVHLASDESASLAEGTVPLPPAIEVDRTSDEPTPSDLVGAIGRWRQHLRWALGGWAAVATTALLLLLLRPAIVSPPERTSADFAPTHRLAITRGESVNTVEIVEGTGSIVLGISGLDMRSGNDVISVEVTSPSGQTLIDRDYSVANVIPPNGLVIVGGPDGLEPGLYMVRFTDPEAEVDTPVAEYRFELVRKPAP